MKRMQCLSAWVGSLVLVASGCAVTSDLTSVTPAQPIQLNQDGSEFNNLYQGGDMFFAGQPTEEGLRQIAGMGVRTVINLRPEDEMAERVDYDEPALVEKLGMTYISLPMTGDSYSAETVDALAEILNDTRGKTLLHCGSSNRVGVIWANYLARHRGVELDEAIELGKAAGMTRDSLVDLVRRIADESDGETD